MTTSKLIQVDGDGYWSREQIRQRRDARRAVVVEYLDPVNRPRAIGMTAREIAERSGLPKQSVAQILAALITEHIAVKRHDQRHAQSMEPRYFLAPKQTAHAIDDATRAAIELYRAEKAKRRGTQQDVIAEARAALQRLDDAQMQRARRIAPDERNA